MVKRKVVILFFIILLSFGTGLIEGQEPKPEDIGIARVRGAGEGRLHFYRNYTVTDYGHQPQNFGIVQDKRGMIYVANNGCVLEYDGSIWRIIEVPGSVVRSLDIDENGVIYIGGLNQIGYLAPDHYGTLKYKSLMDVIKDKRYKTFKDVYNTHCTPDGVYFRTSGLLLRWENEHKRVTVFQSPSKLKKPFYWQKKYYVHIREKGLMVVDGDRLIPAPGGEMLQKKKIYFASPYHRDGNRLLIGTRDSGFYRYDGKQVEPVKFEVERFLKERTLTGGTRLRNGEFALTTSKGLIIANLAGNVTHIYDKTTGLQDENVKHVFQDREGNLWLCLNQGISKIEYTSPLSFYNDSHGLGGIILSVVKSDTLLYAGTTNGLYHMTRPGRFERFSKISTYCWDLLRIGNKIFAATSGGLWQIDETDGNILLNKLLNVNSYCLYKSREERPAILVGTKKGYASIMPPTSGTGEVWRVVQNYSEVEHEVHSLAEDKNANLWMGTRTNGVYYLNTKSGKSSPRLDHYYIQHGLSEGGCHVFWAAGHIMIGTLNGLYRFDTGTQTFVPDYTFGHSFTDGARNVFRVVEEPNKNIWIHSKVRNQLAIFQKDGSYKMIDLPFYRMPVAQTNRIYPEPGTSYTWFAAVNGLFCFDSSWEGTIRTQSPVFIRQMKFLKGAIVFGGYRSDLSYRDTAEPVVPLLPYTNRNFRFTFSAPFYQDEPETQYQYFLEGYDDEWSDFTFETKKDYTNLDSGQYTFRVKSRNIYRQVGTENTFRFRISPPWYKKWWAFILYCFAVAVLIYLIVKWRSRQLVLEKLKLEEIIRLRTQEIEKKNSQLLEQSEKLKEMDQIKSRFFANISHEFRTPITLIMGPLEQMIADCPKQEHERKRKLTLMLRNAQRLLRLINQLLELSKLDSGKMKLKAVPTDIISFVKGICDSFRLAAGQKELDLVFQPGEYGDNKSEDFLLYIDRRVMEDILSNLLLNALKFTPPGGRVTVTVTTRTASLEKIPEGFVEIAVADTGPGIPDHQLAQVFDRFYQAETTYEHNQKGSGIGLALCKELVELHHGTISAGNLDRGGSAFTVKIPIGQRHLTPEEIGKNETTHHSRERNDNREFIMEQLDEENGEPECGPDPETDGEETDIVLVVEDSADMRAYIADALDCFSVIEAENGKDGLEKAREFIPDVIISDIMMPEMDGFELCRELKTDVRTSHIPVILLTAKASEDNIVEGLETGADDYITKPFSTRILNARLKNLIDIRSQLQENYKREITFQPVKTSVSKIDTEFIAELQDVVEKNLSDPEFNVEVMCKQLYMSNTTLYRKIRALCGQTPTEFIRSCRLKRAMELIKNGTGSVTEVAFEVGFSSRAYFTKCFKELFHRLPSER